MLEHLKRIASRLRSTVIRHSPESPPEDPDIAVREPVWRRPSGSSAAAAVEEPEDQPTTMVAAGTQLSCR